MSEEPEENQWNLGSDKEIQEAAKQSRKQPMTAERMGEYVGGFIGVFVGAAACALYLMETETPKIIAIAAIFIGFLFGGAAVGKQVFAMLKRKRSASEINDLPQK